MKKKKKKKNILARMDFAWVLSVGLLSFLAKV